LRLIQIGNAIQAADVSIDTKNNQLLYFTLTSMEMADNDGDVFIINYDPAKMQLLTCAAQAGDGGGISNGPIPDTPLSAVSNSSGQLIIIFTKQAGMSWTGTITTLKFKTLQNGTAAITVDRI
jgi:hypothetical protein